ncbi:MAG: biotin--[acetyl-CoA-carboxylase] ligase [Bacteroidetes bacterium]|jgi:BirA family biotin operon repressor/biotin-[acetyl-CoA-carboxylase] ligase|nr:biotin--[acetyl-CoA-carboxylase] ligase [Bacteroidota bacterium]
METLFIGKSLLFLHEVESTNTYAMNLLRNVNPVEGTVVYTDHQTRGKGQRGAVWTSKTGQNLTLSVILKPHFLGQNNTFYLSKISALAVYDVLTDILVTSQYDIKIKWPNDILINHRKVAGILIENSFTTQALQYSIIGIGLNVNQEEFGEFERSATSLRLAAGKCFDRPVVMEQLCMKLEKWYLKLKEGKTELIDKHYTEVLFGMNQLWDFEDGDAKRFQGTINGVTREGKLMLTLSDSSQKQYDIKELKFIL